MSDFKDKIALVTGAGSGIGRATAKEFAAHGASIVVADFNAEGGAETVSMIEDADGKAVFAQVNVADEDSVKAMVDAAVASYGRLDYLVNSAGIQSWGAPAPLEAGTGSLAWQKGPSAVSRSGCSVDGLRKTLRYGSGVSRAKRTYALP